VFQQQKAWTASLKKTEREKLTDDLARLSEHLRSCKSATSA
jgi:hypothetical protein